MLFLRVTGGRGRRHARNIPDHRLTTHPLGSILLTESDRFDLSLIPTGPAPLSQQLREGTFTAHRRAESTRFARSLAEATTPAPAYATYLTALGLVYDALEDAVSRHAGHPAVGAVMDARLHRREALSRDLSAWSDQRDTHRASADAVDAAVAAAAAQAHRAGQAYASRLAHIADEEPLLLVAHHYVRYLGDLAGGQVVASAWRRRGRRAGLDLYAFDDLASATTQGGASLVPYVRGYRAALDGIALETGQAAALVAEAVTAFELSTAVFEALEPLVPAG